MKTPEENDLERFIHEQLRRLPDRPAPDDLVGNVLAAIAREKSRPWWRQPFTCWPRWPQTVLFTALLGLLGALAYVISGPAEQISFASLYQKVVSLSWLGNVLKAIGGSALLMFQGMAVYWVAAAVAVVVMMYAVCLAGGMALYRIASTHSLRQP